MRNYGYSTIDQIIKKISYLENEKTLEMFALAAKCRKEKELTIDQLYRFCLWKSPLGAHHARKNDAKLTRLVFRECLKTDDDLLKLHVLTALSGISIPTASAILMFLDPNKYGVLDTRVWQLLYDFKKVEDKPNGYNFDLMHWQLYLNVLRTYAAKHRLAVRQVELKLFTAHRSKFVIRRQNTPK
jgi:hypothetical protein